MQDSEDGFLYIYNIEKICENLQNFGKKLKKSDFFFNIMDCHAALVMTK